MQKQRIMRYPCSGTLLRRMLHNARWEAPLDLEREREREREHAKMGLNPMMRY